MADRQLLHRTPEGLRLEIPGPKGFITILTSAVALIVFVLFGTAFLGGLLNGEPVELVTLIVALPLATSFFPLVRRLLWEMFGRETALITSSGIALCNHIVSYGKTATYDRTDCSDFRTVDPVGTRVGQSALDTPRSFARLAFDYETKTIYFGFGLTESEAKEVVAEVGSLYPDYLGFRNSAELPLVAGEPTNLSFQRLAWDGYELRLEPRREILLGATVSSLFFLGFIFFFAVRSFASFSFVGIVIAALLIISLFVTGSQERVVFRKSQIKIGRTLLILISRTYESQSISRMERNMRHPADPEPTPAELRLSRDFGPGEGFNAYGNPPSFRFDYKGKKITFGRNLQDAEARIVIATIRKYFPEYFKDS